MYLYVYQFYIDDAKLQSQMSKSSLPAWGTDTLAKYRLLLPNELNNCAEVTDILDLPTPSNNALLMVLLLGLKGLQAFFT